MWPHRVMRGVRSMCISGAVESALFNWFVLVRVSDRDVI